MRRDCRTVIKEMMGHIPSNKTEFIERLEWCYDDAFYKAPEETIQWVRTQQVLEEHIPEPQEDWEWKVLSIFTTKSKQELEQLFNTHIKQNGSNNTED